MAQPFVPGQVLILPGQSSSPGIGQIAAEAFVRSSINAGVNKLINGPGHLQSANDNQKELGGRSTINSNTIVYNNYGVNGDGQRTIGNSRGLDGTGNVSPVVQYKVSDEELMKLSENLFAKEEVNLGNFATFDLQRKTMEENFQDFAPNV